MVDMLIGGGEIGEVFFSSQSVLEGSHHAFVTE